MAQTTKIITYNVNGVRAAMNKGLLDFLQTNGSDIVLLQETKAMPEQVNTAAIEALGYYHYWFSAEKKGYSGVAIWTKQKPDKVVYGMDNATFDAEGRVIRADFGDTSVFSIYFPSGSSGEARQELKMLFLDEIMRFLKEVQQTRKKLIVSGDFNICHQAIDIHDPVRNANVSGFLPEERAWMDYYFSQGFVDTFRVYNQQKDQYTWWSYRAGARGKNKGWRIDYNTCTENLVPQLRAAKILPQAIHSDHCPVALDLIL
ncbi:MAG: exodeoxyribonuclease III [Chitinophagales bacterium]|nr:exodeoxyribonuclease III [Bacteroidota bacterium]MCB9042684.1 exodeoxyribonuclease III [Chitinophagales bacterium]